MSEEAREVRPSWVVNNKIEEKWQDLNDIVPKFVSVYKEKIIELCELYEENIANGSLNIAVSDVCKYVIEEAQKRQLDIAVRSVYRLVPSRFKNPNFQHFADSDAWLQHSYNTGSVTGVSDLTAPHIVSPETASPDDLRDAYDKFGALEKEYSRRSDESSKEKDKIKAVAHARNISLADEVPADKVSTARPWKSFKGDFYNEVENWREQSHRIQKILGDVLENVEYYSDEDRKWDKEAAAAIKSLAFIFEVIADHMAPYADKKYSQDWIGWFKTEILFKHFGKHAAGTKSRTQAIDELTGRPIDATRGLTREQTGDRLYIIYNRLERFYEANKEMAMWWKIFAEWRPKKLNPAIATRKIKLAPKLSESSFGSDNVKRKKN